MSSLHKTKPLIFTSSLNMNFIKGILSEISLSFRLKANVVLRAAPSPRSKAPQTDSVSGNEERRRRRRITSIIPIPLILFGMGQTHTEEDPTTSAAETTPSSTNAALFSSSRNVVMAQEFAKTTHLAKIDFHKISFAAKETNLLQWEVDMLVLGVTEKDMTKGENSKFQNQILEKLDSKLDGLLSKVAIEEDFTGNTGRSTVISIEDFGPKWVSLIGLGKATCPSTSGFHVFGESVASVAKATQANSAAIALASSEGLTSELKLATASAIAKGILLGTHEANRITSESKKLFPKSFEFIGLGSKPELVKKLKYTEDVCSGVILTKEIVNASVDSFTPGMLAVEAEKIAAAYGDVFTANILDAEQCKELKMSSYVFAAASGNPPKLIHLCYKPPNGYVETKLALVGKGLTFDSGGAYNMKTGPGCSTGLMKFEMGGAAAVLGAAKALGRIKPPGVEVHFIVASCENMITGTGMRPGFVLTASNGKTIEVDNDSAGGLTLADALVYASNQGVDKMVDLATWNGACVAVLGSSTAGIWGLIHMKSVVAGMINTSGREGGGPRFLKQFVGEKVEWLHVDMTGPVWNMKKMTATGFATHSLVEWVLSNATPEV